MANKRITAELEIKTILGNAQQDLNTFQQALKKVWTNGEPPKNILKAYESLSQRLAAMQTLTKKGVVDSSELASVTAEYKAFQKTLRDLGINFKLLSAEQKKALINPQEQNAMKARAQAVADYNAVLKKNQEILAKRQPLEQQKNQLTSDRAGAIQGRDLKQQEIAAHIAITPQMTKDAERYAQALERIDEIQDEIKSTNEAIKKERERGTPEGEQNDNKLTRAKKHLAELQEEERRLQQDQGQNVQGGIDYNQYKQDFAAHEALLIKLQQEYTNFEAAIQSADTALSSIDDKLSKLQVGDQQQAFDSLKQALQGLGVEGIDNATSFNELTEAIQRCEDDALEEVEENIEEVTDSLDKMGKSAEQVGDALDQTTDSMREQNEASREQDAFEAKIKQFLGLSGAAQVLRSALRDAMNTITELDATMTEMAVVTDLSVGDYWDQLPEYSKQASDLGVSINSAYKAATLYYQQGLKGNEVTKISAETLKLAKIAGIDAAEATNKMTAALRGFNMELNETSAQKVSDVYSQLAAITAADVNEISNAMTKTASIAASAGMEFETTAAFLSQIIETTRESAETAGTAMKTVIARFQELKKDPADIGEVEGEIVDANKIETALRSVGVALRDSSGQFRELDDVFLELSSKWDGMDKNTQRYIATIAAGSRQQSRFIAMMSNYGRTQELVTAANNSAGASNKQFEKTTESLAAKMEKLKNAWHEFTMGIVNSDLIKFGVDALTKMLELINNITKGIGKNGLGGGLMKILATIAAFKIGEKIYKKIGGPLSKIYDFIVKGAPEAGTRAGATFAENFQNGFENTINQQGGLLSGQNASGSPQNNQNQNNQNQNNQNQNNQNQNNQNQRQGFSIGRMLGWDHFQAGRQAFAQRNSARQRLDNLNSAGGNRAYRERQVEGARTRLELARSSNGTQDEIDAAQRALTQAQLNLDEYEEAEQEFAQSSNQAWGEMGKAVTQFGQAVSGVGAGLAALGGILTSLGLEEFGEGLTTVGTIITFIGGALMAIPPILTAITAHPIIALITVIVGLIIGLVVAVKSFIDNASAGAKLEKAQKNAEAAKEAAEQAREAYDNLNQSLNDLSEQQNTLDDLREGTEEWNKAVQEMNSSVLELIDKYPELAALVENEGGVLKLDMESDAVQDVMKKYEGKAAQAKALEYFAQMDVTKANQAVNFSELGAVEAVGWDRGWDQALPGLALTTVAAIINPAIGAIALAGTSAASAIYGASAKTDKTLQEATEALALSVQEGTTAMEADDMKKFLLQQGVAADEAEIMAESFAANTESLLEFGAATQASTAAMQAQYAAIAMQAKGMIDLSKYTQEEQEQMTGAVDSDMMEEMKQERIEALKKEYAGSNSDEFEKMKVDFAKEQYGANARVKDNKIVDEKGETLREFDSDEDFANAIASAQAVKDIAATMEKMPVIIDRSAMAFEKKVAGAGDAFEKLFLGTNGDKLVAGEITALQQAINSGALHDAWLELSDEERAVYDNNEGKFIEETKERLDAASKSFKTTNANLDKFNKNISLNGKFSAGAAKGWVDQMKIMDTGGASGEQLESLDSYLDSMISRLAAEDVDLVMSAINAIDITDSGAWDELQYTFEELGVMANMDTVALQNFIETGKLASHAIEKINFDTLANDINSTYQLLNKIKEGGRKYSEEDYKALIASNKHLEKSFTQIGDEFIYVGGSMETLTEAVKENTVAQLQEANRQLKSRTEMSDIIQQYEENNPGSVSTMDEFGLMTYLTDLREAFQQKGLDIADFGIAGLTGATDFSKASAEQLREWADAIAIEGGKNAAYKNEYADSVEKANIQRYTYNDAAYNAKMAVEGGEYASQHQEALILQAIQSGAVTNSMIEAYRKAIESGNESEIKTIGEQIATATDKIVEASEGREEFKNLADRVSQAIENARQEEIDKLSELNDTMQNTNQKLIDKIQQQIDEDRQERENQKTKEEIANMQAQKAYLGMDTSGANAMNLLELEQKIAESEENYQDQLIDQAIQHLTDVNEEAAEQRQQQIDLLQSQLEWQVESGEIAREAENIVQQGLDQVGKGVDALSTEMGQLLWGEEGKNLGDLASEDWVSSLVQSATMAQNWYALQGIKKPNETGASEESNSAPGATTDLVEQQKKNAIEAARRALTSATGGGFAVQSKDSDSAFMKAYESYTQVSGEKISKEDFAKMAAGKDYTKYDFEHIGIAYIDKDWANDFNWEDGQTEADEGWIRVDGKDYHAKIDGVNSAARSAAKARDLQENAVFKYADGYYIYHGDLAYNLTQVDRNGWKAPAFKTGGLADFTGPAWLDGTKSKPEYVLNAEQTERFFSLIDVLENLNNGTEKDITRGDNYYNIQIDVEKLTNDYDVEKMAEKIRKMITEDALYRNVNSINLIR